MLQQLCDYFILFMKSKLKKYGDTNRIQFHDELDPN